MNGSTMNNHIIIKGICYSISLIVSLLFLSCNDLDKTITKKWKDQVIEISDNLLAINTDSTTTDNFIDGNKAKVIGINSTSSHDKES